MELNLPNVAFALQKFTAFAWLGLIWTVQLVSYPGLLLVPPEQFPAAHRAQSRRITWVVVPLFIMEIAACLAWLYLLPDTRTAWHFSVVACVAAAWTSTFLIQIPLHHRLSRHPEITVLRRLIATNWIRTIAWTGKAGLMVWHALAPSTPGA